jgi:hypothetical protein
VSVSVNDNNGHTASTTVTSNASGAFSATLSMAGFNEGTSDVVATATDLVGNTGSATTTTTRDTVKPVVTGLASTNTTADQTSTTVTGSTDPGASVSVSAVTPGGTPVTGTTTAQPSGAFSIVLQLKDLPDGQVTVTATATDAAGNVGDGATATSTKDSQGPTITGLSGTDVNAANKVTTVTGTVSESGADVVVTATDGTTTVTKTLTDLPSTALSTTLDLTTLADKADILVTAVATDSSANTGPAATDTLSKDTVGPALSGLGATGVTTASPKTTVTGTTAPGQLVSISVANGSSTASGTATGANGTGAFSAEIDLASFPDGTFTVTATATDAAGNPTTATTTASKDATGPTVTGLAATASSFTSDASTVTGSTEAGATVALVAKDAANKTVTGTATAGSGGSFSASLDLSTLADGTITVTATATDTGGNTGPSSSTTTTRTSAEQDRYVGLTSPVRVLDSRSGTDNVGTSPGLKRGAVELDLSGRVPAGATGAVLNVTVTSPQRSGFVVVYPSGTTRPGTSNVNFAAGQTQANEVVTALSSSRKAVVYVDSVASAHVIADLVGYLTPQPGAGGYLTPVTPKRVLGEELRRNLGSSVGSSSVVVDVSTAVPAGSTGVVLNVTVASPSQSGFVVAYPDGTTQPGTSNVNFAANQVQANEVISQLGTGGKVRLTLSRGQARVIVDVVGAITPSTATGAGRFTPLATPVRALDTREAIGVTGTARRTPSTPVELLMPSVIPAEAKGLILNVTSTGQLGSGFVVVYPTGSAKPGTSNVNFRQGVNQANEVIVKIGTGRKVTFSVGGGGTPSTHVIADIVGYLK